MKSIWQYRKWFTLAVIVTISVWLLMPPKAEPTAVGAPPPVEESNAKYVIRFSPGMSYMPDTIPYGIGRPIHGLADVVSEFERLHPDVKIKLVTVPGVREYLVTQLSSGSAPEIINVNVEDVWTDVQKNWYVPLDTFLEAPNAFINDPAAPGGKQWWDQFKYQAISRGKAAPDNLNYCISFDMIETGIFYNKRIFDEVGIQPPNTWEEWMEGMAKIKAAGHIPLLMSIDWFNDWCTDLMFDQVYNNLLPGIDMVQDPTREAYLRGYLDWDELTFLYQKGFFHHDDPRYRAVWSAMKEMRQYCNQNLVSTDFVREFVTEEAAMIWNTSQLCYRLEADPQVTFDYGIFYLPSFTKQTTKYASEIPMCVIGGSGTQLEVTNSAVNDTPVDMPWNERIQKSEKLKWTIRFLQFLMIPENYNKVVNEYPCMLPNLVGVPPLPMLQPFDDILQRDYTTTKWLFTFDLKFSEIQRRILEMYLNDAMTLDELMVWQEQNLETATKNLLERKPIDSEKLQRKYDALSAARATMEDLPDGAK